MHSGDSLIIFPLFIIAYFIFKDYTQKIIILVLLTIIITGIVIFILKNIFKKQRPEGNESLFIRRNDPYSFPSGHSARVWSIFSIVSLSEHSLQPFLLIWAILVSSVRIHLKLHFLKDVIAGITIGIMVSFIMFNLVFPYIHE
jgi:undecaprenyl-diphosphatase